MKKLILISLISLVSGCASVFEQPAFPGEYQMNAPKGSPEESVAVAHIKRPYAPVTAVLASPAMTAKLAAAQASASPQ